MNQPTIILLALVLALVAAIGMKVYRNKKAGKSSCAGCSGCCKSGCHTRENKV